MNDSPCNEMDGELVCAMEHGHRTDYHEDVEGHRWPAQEQCGMIDATYTHPGYACICTEMIEGEDR